MPSSEAHSKFGASSAHRWFHCPGSVRLCADVADVPNKYSAEGIAAHELAALCLKEQDNADFYIGEPFNQLEVTKEMASAVQVYLDAVRAQMTDPEAEIEVERRFYLPHIHDKLFGTNDALVYQPSTLTLHVFDLKYGAGVYVEVLENLQLLYYALGAATTHGNRGVDKIVMTIVQPRIGKDPDEWVRKYEVDAVALLEWGDDLRAAVERASAHDAPLVPGTWCKFCKADFKCPALEARAKKAAQDEFGDIVSPAVISSWTPDETGKRLADAEVMEALVKAYRKHAFEEGKAGRMATGYKFVAKVARRKWIEPDTVMTKLIAAGHKPEEVCSPITPAKLEKFSKAAYAQVAEHVEQKSSGVNLVPLSNKKPAVTIDPNADFEDVDLGE